MSRETRWGARLGELVMSHEGSEVDAHDDAPERGPADFTEPSGGEHTCGADVSSPTIAPLVVTGYPSTARAPRSLAKSAVAPASADAIPRFRKLHA
jgi:hypothetical protein